MRQIVINPTYSCNRSCDYCYARDFSKKWPGEISLDDIEYIFKWLNRQKAELPVNFLGGEPTLF